MFYHHSYMVGESPKYPFDIVSSLVMFLKSKLSKYLVLYCMSFSFSINVCLILYSFIMKFYLVNFKLFYEKKRDCGRTRGLSPKIAKTSLVVQSSSSQLEVRRSFYSLACQLASSLACSLVLPLAR